MKKEMFPKEFREWAEKRGIELFHPDDYGDWWDCWTNGFETGVKVLSKVQEEIKGGKGE